MTWQKKLFFSCLTTVMVVGILESICRVSYYLIYGELHRREESSERRGKYHQSPATRNSDVPNRNRRTRHPFFGFTSYWPDHDLNRLPPRQRQNDTIVIGMLGGSVAHQVLGEFRSQIVRYFSRNNIDMNPIILDLSHGGMKQPQQLMAVSYYIARGGEFDLIINLDGFNDFTAPHDNVRRGMSPFFPSLWDTLTDATTDEILLAGRIANLSKLQDTIDRFSLTRFSRRSAIFGLLARNLNDLIESRIHTLYQNLSRVKTEYSMERHGPKNEAWDKEALREAAVKLWYRSSVLLAGSAKMNGAEYYHFLQPNQYLPGSKPLTEQEMVQAYIPDHWWEDNYVKILPLLVRYGYELKKQGIRYFDLTGIFRDNHETLYSDKCCHLNARGNALLAAYILRYIKPALLPKLFGASRQPPSHALDVPESSRMVSGGGLLSSHLITFSNSAEYTVSLQGRKLVYVSSSCTPRDTQRRFFLHIVPSDLRVLPSDRIQFGSDHYDFRVNYQDAETDEGKCVVERRLPDYDIVAIKTGQYDPSHQNDMLLWYAAFLFDN